MRDIQQKPTESEMEYSARLNQAELRCGNVHPIAEKITVFISGLNPAIEPLITRVWYNDSDSTATTDTHGSKRTTDQRGHVWALEQCVATGILATTDYTLTTPD